MILDFFHPSHLPPGFRFIAGTPLTFGNMKALAPPFSYPSHRDSQILLSLRSVNAEHMHCSLRSWMSLLLDEWIFCFVLFLHTGCILFLPVLKPNNPEPKKKKPCLFSPLFLQIQSLIVTSPQIEKIDFLRCVILWLPLPGGQGG